MGAGSAHAGAFYVVGAAIVTKLASEEVVHPDTANGDGSEPYAFSDLCDEDFLAHAWGWKSHLLAQGTAIQRLFDLPDLVDVLRAARDVSYGAGGALRAVGGTALNGRMGMASPQPTLQKGSLPDFFRNATLVLSSLQTRLPRLAAWSRAFARTFGISCEISLYISPPGSQGMPLHNDAHDKFVAQVLGAKAWKVWDLDGQAGGTFDWAEEIAAAPFRHTVSYAGSEAASFDALPEASADVRLHPGGLLYIPRGSLHVASTAHLQDPGQEAEAFSAAGQAPGALRGGASGSHSPEETATSSVHLAINALTQGASYALVAYQLTAEPSVQGAAQAAGWEPHRFRQALMRAADRGREGAALRRSLPLGWLRWAAAAGQRGAGAAVSEEEAAAGGGGGQ